MPSPNYVWSIRREAGRETSNNLPTSPYSALLYPYRAKYIVRKASKVALNYGQFPIGPFGLGKWGEWERGKEGERHKRVCS